MVFFNMVHLNTTVIYNSSLGKEVGCIAFLQNGITHVLFISKHGVQRTCLPVILSIPVLYLLSLKYPAKTY